MPLSPGDKLGHYEVLSLLGQGGMGEVYRVRDTTLKRDVAVKVLSEAFLRDPERMARFQREAEVLASLDHPNIGHIHGIVDFADCRGLVLALIEGPTLADRIAAGPLPLDEAIAISRQIIEALEYAHDRGVVHRDLKPANVKITPDGVVKVLDFGLAKVLENEAPASSLGDSPTLTMGHTEAGVILGTAAYMSPEQAVGRTVDRRTDIFSFGAVLFEMFSGKRAFGGTTTPDVLEAVVKNDPDWATLPTGLPKYLRRLLERTLTKDRKRRLQAIGEARIALENPDVTTEAGLKSGLEVGMRPPSKLPWVMTTLAAMLAITATAILWSVWRGSTAPTANQSLIRLNADLGPDAIAAIHNTFALSRDGQRLVFTVRDKDGVPHLAARLLSDEGHTVLSGTDNARNPFFSPEGDWIGFFADTKLKKVAFGGGAPITLCDSGEGYGGSWGEDGSIVASLGYFGRLSRIPANGGMPQELAPPPVGELLHRWPQILPGGKTALVTAASSISNFDNAHIAAVSLSTGEAKAIVPGGYAGRYVAGHILYLREGTLYSVGFDPEKLEVEGTPTPMVNNVGGNSAIGAGHWEVTASGVLAYAGGNASAKSWPVLWLDHSGHTSTLIAKAAIYGIPQFSPDGHWLTVSVRQGGGADTYLYDLVRERLSRLTTTGGDTFSSTYATWMPDGKHFIVRHPTPLGFGLAWYRADGGGSHPLLYESTTNTTPQDISPDGRWLVFQDTKPKTSIDLFLLPLDTSDPEHPKPAKPELFVGGPAVETSGAFSPDGHWLAYRSSESGRDEVYVRPFPNPPGGTGTKWPVSVDGGGWPIWSRDGHSLFFEAADHRLMVVDYKSQRDSFTTSPPRVWADVRVRDLGGNRAFSLHPDGHRFAIIPADPPSPEEKGNAHVTFLLNFGDELRRRTAPVK